MSFFVYALCAVTSFCCCALLLRQHKREPGELLFHSAIAFLCFAAGNLLLFIDRIVMPQIDLRFWRNAVSLLGVSLLLLGLMNIKQKDER